MAQWLANYIYKHHKHIDRLVPNQARWCEWCVFTRYFAILMQDFCRYRGWLHRSNRNTPNVRWRNSLAPHIRSENHVTDVLTMISKFYHLYPLPLSLWIDPVTRDVLLIRWIQTTVDGWSWTLYTKQPMDSIDDHEYFTINIDIAEPVPLFFPNRRSFWNRPHDTMPQGLRVASLVRSDGQVVIVTRLRPSEFCDGGFGDWR